MPRIAGCLALLVVVAPAWALALPAWATAPGRNGLIAIDAVSNNGGTGQTWVLRPDGSGLMPFPVRGDIAYAPDGRRLALVGGPHDGTLWVADTVGANRVEVLKSGKCAIGDVAWEPSGDLLYFGCFVSGHGSSLFSVAVAGGTPRLIRREADEPDVSSTGRLAYSTVYSDDPHIYTSDLGGGDVRDLGRGESPSWSPDGTRIAFVRDEFLNANRADVYTASADGSDARRLWKAPPSATASEVTWSPDGSSIALVREEFAHDQDSLSVLDVTTGALRTLLTQSRVHADLLTGLDWQPLQGVDPIVLPPSPKPKSCALVGSRTLVATHQARVFVRNGLYYGCLFRRDRRFRLAGPSGSTIVNMERVRLAGPYVGLAFERLDTGAPPSEEAGSWARVRVVDLRSGRVKLDQSAVRDRSVWSEVFSLVMTTRGAAAWIARRWSDYVDAAPPGCRRSYFISDIEAWHCNYAYELRTVDRLKTRQLDSGFAIRPKSLKLDSRRVSWRNGRRHRSAELH